MENKTAFGPLLKAGLALGPRLLRVRIWTE